MRQRSGHAEIYSASDYRGSTGPDDVRPIKLRDNPLSLGQILYWIVSKENSIMNEQCAEITRSPLMEVRFCFCESKNPNVRT